MKDRTLRGRAAIVGIGETPYLKHGQAPVPEFRLALQAILNACAQAALAARPLPGGRIVIAPPLDIAVPAARRLGPVNP